MWGPGELGSRYRAAAPNHLEEPQVLKLLGGNPGNVTFDFVCVLDLVGCLYGNLILAYILNGNTSGNFH